MAERFGEGGMGVSYWAEDGKLERTVALKLLAQRLLEAADTQKRFLREAKAPRARALSRRDLIAERPRTLRRSHREPAT